VRVAVQLPVHEALEVKEVGEDVDRCPRWPHGDMEERGGTNINVPIS
jgi:hypothetical protein